MNFFEVPVIDETNLRHALFAQYDVEFDLKELFDLKEGVGNFLWIDEDMADIEYITTMPEVHCVLTFLRDVFPSQSYVFIILD